MARRRDLERMQRAGRARKDLAGLGRVGVSGQAVRTARAALHFQPPIRNAIWHGPPNPSGGYSFVRGAAVLEKPIMRRLSIALASSLLLLGSIATSAVAQEAPLCGPPGGELPATIVGSGTIVGTSGDDVIVGSPTADTIDGGGGDDIICAGGGNDVVSGGRGNDELIGDELESAPFAPSNGNNDDVLMGGPGDDVVVGLGGNDSLEGGPGNDTLIGMGGNDVGSGGPGDDTAFGGPLDDRLSGGPGDDTLFGNFGSDRLVGGPGSDFLNGDNPQDPGAPVPDPLPFPPGSNNDVCIGGGGAGVDTLLNCESSS
jgi:Ca2+-binding RTX toxin-like protein